MGSAMAVAIASRKNLSGKSIFSVIGIDLPNKEGQKRIDSIKVLKVLWSYLSNISGSLFLALVESFLEFFPTSANHPDLGGF